MATAIKVPVLNLPSPRGPLLHIAQHELEGESSEDDGEDSSSFAIDVRPSSSDGQPVCDVDWATALATVAALSNADPGKDEAAAMPTATNPLVGNAETAKLVTADAGLVTSYDEGLGDHLADESGTGTDADSSALGSSRAELLGGTLPRVPSAKVVIPSFIPPVNVRRHNVLSAAEHNATADLRELVAEQVDPDMTDSDGRTALMASCELGHVECLEILLAACADTSKEDEEGACALHKAAWEGHERCIQLLLEAGADLDKADDEGKTPLFVSCQRGRVECTSLMLRHNADVARATGDGRTPLLISCFNGNVECARLLLAAHADVDAADDDGGTPLYKACVCGSEPCASLLIGAGAIVDRADNDGASPLYVACWAGHVDCVTLLVAASATPSMSASDCRSPLLACCASGRTECARILIDAGADTEHEWRGQTPLQAAWQRGHTECVALLEAIAEAAIKTCEASSPRNTGSDFEPAFDGGVGYIMEDPSMNWKQKALALQEMFAKREETWRAERDELHLQLTKKHKELERTHARLTAQEEEFDEKLMAKDEEVRELLTSKEEETRERIEAMRTMLVDKEEEVSAALAAKDAKMRSQAVAREAEFQAQMNESADVQAQLRVQLADQEKDRQGQQASHAAREEELQRQMADLQSEMHRQLEAARTKLVAKEAEMIAQLAELQAHTRAQIQAKEQRTTSPCADVPEPTEVSLASEEAGSVTPTSCSIEPAVATADCSTAELRAEETHDVRSRDIDLVFDHRAATDLPETPSIAPTSKASAIVPSVWYREKPESLLNVLPTGTSSGFNTERSASTHSLGSNTARDQLTSRSLAKPRMKFH